MLVQSGDCPATRATTGTATRVVGGVTGPPARRSAQTWERHAATLRKRTARSQAIPHLHIPPEIAKISPLATAIAWDRVLLVEGDNVRCGSACSDRCWSWAITAL